MQKGTSKTCERTSDLGHQLLPTLQERRFHPSGPSHSPNLRTRYAGYAGRGAPCQAAESTGFRLARSSRSQGRLTLPGARVFALGQARPLSLESLESLESPKLAWTCQSAKSLLFCFSSFFSVSLAPLAPLEPLAPLAPRGFGRWCGSGALRARSSWLAELAELAISRPASLTWRRRDPRPIYTDDDPAARRLSLSSVATLEDPSSEDREALCEGLLKLVQALRKIQVESWKRPLPGQWALGVS